jgi:hypothetical protein
MPNSSHDDHSTSLTRWRGDRRVGGRPDLVRPFGRNVD